MSLFALSDSRRRLRDVSQIVYKRPSGDPSHPCNASDADWQSGYLLGCHTGQDSTDDIRIEWENRKKPSGQELTDDTVLEREKISKWRSWKAGYYAGRFANL